MAGAAAVGGRRRERTRGESESERLDRELKELTDELRVALPGRAGALRVPARRCRSRTASRTSAQTQRDAFFDLVPLRDGVVDLPDRPVGRCIASSGAAATRSASLRAANKLALVGATFLALAMTGVVFLITDMLFNEASAAAIAGAAAGMIVALWYVVPLYSAG